ncbi:MAG: Wzz/FepE/Etk N-terminal domain-containing protein [Candidatus Saganbacteria bacterium]|nr:Wzz/FepE/Etk N-terminal domain-containing protein [Candidatus Saganbacteria bacterium]
MEDEINLIDILKVIFKRRKIVVWFFIIAILLGFLQVKSIPKEYAATVVLLPISDSGGLFSALSEISFLSDSAGKGSLGNVLAVLKSRSLALRLIEKEGLTKVLLKKLWDEKKQAWKTSKPPTQEEAAMFLSAMTKVDVDRKDGLLRITITNEDPELATKIANAYPIVLGTFLSEQSISANFRILDPAIVPKMPLAKGSMKKMLFMGILGIGISVFFVFALEYFQKMKEELFF